MKTVLLSGICGFFSIRKGSAMFSRRRIFTTGLIIMLGLVVFQSNLLAQEKPPTGHIQVVCAPGVTILIDGKFKGVTHEDVGGLIIQDVPAGKHMIKAVKKNFLPRVDRIIVIKGEVQVHEISSFRPKIKITQEGDRTGAIVVAKTGSLLIQSLPVECLITITDLSIVSSRKNKDRWKAEDIAVGQYKAVFKALGKKLEYAFEIKAGQTTKLMVNFINSKVVDEQKENSKSNEKKFKDLVKAAKKSMKDKKPRDALAMVYEALKIKQDDKDALSLRARIYKKIGVITNSIGMTFIKVLPGEFRMGRPEKDTDRCVNEHMPRDIKLTKAFYMQTTEVTQAQWKAIMGSNPSKLLGEHYPIENISWDDAVMFLKKLSEKEHVSYRLPTEAEWEYSCRAGSKKKYSFGDDDKMLPKHCWFKENSDGKTQQVSMKKPNAWGLYDMHGNVREWCHDWFEARYRKSDLPVDPTGPEDGKMRVLRGGAFDDSARACRSAHTNIDWPNSGKGNYGFRALRVIK